mmetsp:Transcript_6407/g.11722  ORF Transcript_6407/g.11722 Transcript_6407/m.11722 type:complete len:218 (-) Transcript_6407:148-801(-)
MLLGAGLVESEAVVERDDVIPLPMHNEERAHQLPHPPVVGIEVEAAPDAGRATTGFWLWVHHLDAREQRRVQDDPSQRLLGSQVRRRATPHALAVGNNPLWRKALCNQVVVGRFHVGVGVARACPARGSAVAAVLNTADLHPEDLCQLVVGAHHHPDVCGIAVAMEQHDRRLTVCLAVRLPCRAHLGAPQPDHRDLIARPGCQDVHFGSRGGAAVEL